MRKENVVVGRVFMSSNYFALFKIEPAFNISFDELEKKYIELSKTDINERQSQNMENINKAYQVLKSPLKRWRSLSNLRDDSQFNFGEKLPTKMDTLEPETMLLNSIVVVVQIVE